MIIFQALLAFMTRSAGKLLNTVFGWATIMLFGKVPQDRQIYISVMALGSVAWIVAVLSIILPSLGSFLLTFMLLPDWVEENWIRLAFLIAAIVLPLLIGVVSILMLEPAGRPKGAGATATAALKGIPTPWAWP